jgi:hypothetical protein
MSSFLLVAALEVLVATMRHQTGLDFPPPPFAGVSFPSERLIAPAQPQSSIFFNLTRANEHCPIYLDGHRCCALFARALLLRDLFIRASLLREHCFPKLAATAVSDAPHAQRPRVDADQNETAPPYPLIACDQRVTPGVASPIARKPWQMPSVHWGRGSTGCGRW